MDREHVVRRLWLAGQEIEFRRAILTIMEDASGQSWSVQAFADSPTEFEVRIESEVKVETEGGNVFVGDARRIPAPKPGEVHALKGLGPLELLE